MVSFFLPMHLQVLAVFGGSSYFVVRSFQSGGKVETGKLAWAFFLGSFYLLYLMALPFTGPQFGAVIHRFCESRVSILLFPIVFALISPALIELILGELAFLVHSCLFVCLLANGAFAVALYTKSPIFIPYGMPADGFHGFSHVDYRVFFERFNGYHPTYMSMMLVFSMCILFFHSSHLKRVDKYAMFYALLLCALALVAKSPLIAMGLIFVHFTWLKRKSLKQYKWPLAGTILLVVLSYLLLPSVSQRINEMFLHSTATGNGNFADNSVNERKMIWNVDTGMLSHYWLAGCGPGRLLHLLKVRYLFYSLQFGRDVNSFDPHNEYLYQWLSFGIIGIIAFVSVLTKHFINAIRRKEYAYLYLMLILGITFFTESILARQHGVVFYAFFSSLFFYRFTKKEYSA